MSKIVVALPVLNQQHHTINAINSFKRLQAEDNVYMVADNGSNPAFESFGIEVDLVHRYESNMGLPFVMNELLKEAREIPDCEYVLFTHTDVLMFEQDWDTKTLEAINEAGNVGLAGYFGALGIGTYDIYKSEYRMQQMARQTPISGDRCKLDHMVHGQSRFSEKWQKCAVLDGFSLIVRANSEINFWNQSIHHMYDNDICLRSIDLGYQNIVINMDVDHIGGQTDVNENWTEDKTKVHADSHIPFYNYWKPGENNICLPYYV